MAMTNLQYLLGKLAEEAAEVAQIALKAQQFGLDEIKPGQPYTNAQRIEQELNDLYGVLTLLQQEGFYFQTDTEQICRKINKVVDFREYSIKLGMVEDIDG